LPRPAGLGVKVCDVVDLFGLFNGCACIARGSAAAKWRGGVVTPVPPVRLLMRAPQLSLKGRALRYLSMREHSRIELGRKLSRHAEEGDDVEALLDFLEQNNWLSTERFSESLINRRGARYGNSRIVAELQQHGVSGEALKELKSGLVDTEAARAADVWRRKFGEVAVDAAGRAKQMRFLLQRGFSQAAVRHAIKGIDDEHDDG
jgi:regulatory protein